MASELQITRENKKDVLVVRMSGDVTSAAAGDLLSVLDAGSRKVVLDFAGVGYINSSGIAVIIQLLSRAQKSTTVVRSSGLTPHFQKVFQMVGLTSYTELFDTTDAALQDL